MKQDDGVDGPVSKCRYPISSLGQYGATGELDGRPARWPYSDHAHNVIDQSVGVNNADVTQLIDKECSPVRGRVAMWLEQERMGLI